MKEDFKNINIPMPYYDSKKDVLLYINNNENHELSYYNNLINPLEDITCISLYYPYETKELNNNEYENHSHSFEDVVGTLYNYPESFKINDEQKLYYSNQELAYLKKTKKLLLFYGLKDIINFKDKSRYKNNKYKKYFSACKWEFNNDDLDKIINKNFIFKVTINDNEKVYKKNDYTALLLDKEYNVKAFIMFTNSQKVIFKNIKDKCLINKFKDNEEVIIYNYKIIEKF